MAKRGPRWSPTTSRCTTPKTPRTEGLAGHKLTRASRESVALAPQAISLRCAFARPCCPAARQARIRATPGLRRPPRDMLASVCAQPNPLRSALLSTQSGGVAPEFAFCSRLRAKEKGREPRGSRPFVLASLTVRSELGREAHAVSARSSGNLLRHCRGRVGKSPVLLVREVLAPQTHAVLLVG